MDERNELLDEVRHLKLELEEEKNKKRYESKSGYSLNNGSMDEETCKILSDYRFKLQKAEQDVSTLQATVSFGCTSVALYITGPSIFYYN